MIHKENKRVLLITEATGIYIPQVWAKQAIEYWHNYSKQDLSIILKGPDHPEYWDAWESVMDSAEHRDPNDPEGEPWRLYQDGDLWAIRDDYEWDDDEI